FSWTGQIARFSVEGNFSFDASEEYEDGIVREEDLESFNIKFFDPDGNLLRTYTDNQDLSRYPTFNFAFDTQTEEILQDGTWDVDDDINPERNGFMFGEGNPDLRGMEDAQSGLAFWTRPSDDKLPHLHVDDWNDELGFPIGYSTHEDVN
ncbi:MAG: PEP-CTERM sorting domain-containing protein, partial [Cyanobacteria bacterium J06607_6]